MDHIVKSKRDKLFMFDLCLFSAILISEKPCNGMIMICVFPRQPLPDREEALESEREDTMRRIRIPQQRRSMEKKLRIMEAARELFAQRA